MADFKMMLSHTKKFEGAHSSDPYDNALKSGHSGVLGKTINPKTGKQYDSRYPNNFIHTNAGVIWATYKEYCRKKNIPLTAEGFLQMTEKTWQDIFKTLYWDFILGDQIESQGIAENLMEAVWGGGSGLLVQQLYQYMNEKFKTNLKVRNYMTKELVNAINKNIRSKSVYKPIMDYLYTKRMDYLKSLADWNRYKNGWTRRMNELYDRTIKYPITQGGLLGFKLGLFPIFTLGAIFFF